MSQHEIIPAEKSAGHICASTTVSCPPAVPIAVSGEVISEDCVELFKAYGIEFVDVIV
jgi:arginine/lysine/ornithine decarboxylase